MALPCVLLLGACTFPTTGSQAPRQGQTDCIAATARHFKVSADQVQVESSQVSTSANLYEARMLHVPTGRRAKCTVDENGAVQGVVDLR